MTAPSIRINIAFFADRIVYIDEYFAIHPNIDRFNTPGEFQITHLSTGFSVLTDDSPVKLRTLIDRIHELPVDWAETDPDAITAEVKSKGVPTPRQIWETIDDPEPRRNTPSL